LRSERRTDIEDREGSRKDQASLTFLALPFAFRLSMNAAKFRAYKGISVLFVVYNSNPIRLGGAVIRPEGSVTVQPVDFFWLVESTVFATDHAHVI
jgi:hypothetical protein